MTLSLPTKSRSLFTDSHIVSPYNETRPDIYQTATQEILLFLFENGFSPDSILDVGCGTGRSTVAFADVAESIVGVDPSSQMLGKQAQHPQIEFLQGAAESLPVDRQFDLVVASMSFEYFQPSRFFSELDRVLSHDGVFATYTCQFGGDCGNAGFRQWLTEDLFARYPERVSRPGVKRKLLESSGHPFQLVQQIPYEIVEPYSIQRFVDYILTKSNFSGIPHHSIPQLRQDIYDKVQQFWGQSHQLMRFNGMISFVARSSSDRIAPTMRTRIRNSVQRLKLKVTRKPESQLSPELCL